MPGIPCQHLRSQKVIAHLNAILSAFALTLLIILSIVSVNALSNAAKSLKTVYHDRLIPTGQLGRIELAVQTIQTELLL